jgi:hypothetical protein
MKKTFYHGTSKENAEAIMKEGFKLDKKTNWEVKSKKGFVYFSLAYAPFYAMNASDETDLAIVKVEIDIKDLYPEDDFIMRKLGKPVYTQEEIDSIDFEKYKIFWAESLKTMGNVAAKPETVKVIGIGVFDGDKLIFKCDPTISPTNYAVMGFYYKDLTEWLYQGKDVMEFHSFLG